MQDGPKGLRPSDYQGQTEGLRGERHACKSPSKRTPSSSQEPAVRPSGYIRPALAPDRCTLQLGLSSFQRKHSFQSWGKLRGDVDQEEASGPGITGTALQLSPGEAGAAERAEQSVQPPGQWCFLCSRGSPVCLQAEGGGEAPAPSSLTTGVPSPHDRFHPTALGISTNPQKEGVSRYQKSMG